MVGNFAWIGQTCWHSTSAENESGISRGSLDWNWIVTITSRPHCPASEMGASSGEAHKFISSWGLEVSPWILNCSIDKFPWYIGPWLKPYVDTPISSVELSVQFPAIVPFADLAPTKEMTVLTVDPSGQPMLAVPPPWIMVELEVCSVAKACWVNRVNRIKWNSRRYTK